jgi:hypothetical protein
VFVCAPFESQLLSLNRASRSLAKTGFQSSAPAQAGSPKSRNKVFRFFSVSGPFRVSFGGCFLRCFGRPLGTISVPLGSLGRSSGLPCAPWGLQGWLFSVPGYA